MKDEIIDEVRKNRDEFAARFNYDIDKIFEYLREQQKTSGRKYASFSTKKAPAGKVEKTKKAA